MKRTFSYSLLPLLLVFLSFTLFTFHEDLQRTNTDHSNINNSVPNDSFKLTGVYAFGKVPYSSGVPDSIQVRTVVNIPNSKPKKITVKVYNDSNVLCDPLITLNDSCFSGTPKEILNKDIFNSLAFDTTVSFKPEDFGLKENDIIIVSAVVGDTSIVNQNLDFFQHCYKVTKNGWSHIDSCKSDTTASVFTGRPGNIVAGFRNRGSSTTILNSIDYTFLDTTGSGLKPYKVVVYADNGSGKPGSLLHLSSALTSPAGTGAPQTVTYNLATPVNISPGNKFYVGLRQTSSSNIKAAYQKENPVRKKAFFFTSPDTTGNWYDFSDSSKNLIPDISLKVQNGQLNLTSLVEGFYNNVTNKMVKDTMRVYLRNSTAPYAIKDSSRAYLDSNGFARFFFSDMSNGTPYYIQLKHRNSVKTWSASAQTFTSGNLTYDFTTSGTQAYGSNMKLKGSRFCIFGGDADLSGFVNLTDIVTVFNAISAFSTGYIPSDLDGNNIANLTDLLICYNNSALFVSESMPP